MHRDLDYFSGKVSCQLSLTVSFHCLYLFFGTRKTKIFSDLNKIDHMPNLFYSKDYGIRYCDGNQTKFGWNFSGSSNMEELKLLLETRFMIRRLKCNVLTQLPSKIRFVFFWTKKCHCVNYFQDRWEGPESNWFIQGGKKHND